MLVGVNLSQNGDFNTVVLAKIFTVAPGQSRIQVSSRKLVYKLMEYSWELTRVRLLARTRDILGKNTIFLTFSTRPHYITAPLRWHWVELLQEGDVD